MTKPVQQKRRLRGIGIYDLIRSVRKEFGPDSAIYQNLEVWIDDQKLDIFGYHSAPFELVLKLNYRFREGHWNVTVEAKLFTFWLAPYDRKKKYRQRMFFNLETLPPLTWWQKLFR